MFHKILVPLDGSALSEWAIPHAEQFARIFGSRIIIFRVIEPGSYEESPLPIDPVNWQIRRVEVEQYMQGMAERIREHLQSPERQAGSEHSTDDQVEYVIHEGKTAENILDFARDENIDLLVISSHGSGGLSRWNMSSVIQKVIELINLPLLIIRSSISQGQSDEPVLYQRILIPTDSSARAESALTAGVLLMQGKSDSDLHLGGNLSLPANPSIERKLFLCAALKLPEIPIPKPYPVEVSKLSEQLLEVSREAIYSYLKTMQNRLPVETEIRVVESNNVYAAIQGVAEQENIDLIILSAHGNTEQLDHPFGNATRNFIAHSTKSLLVIQDLPRSEAARPAEATSDLSSGERFNFRENHLNR